MSNSIKYNTSLETLSLNTGDFWIGTGDVGKGPTSTTGFWSAINPSNIDNDFADGYTIYVNKASQGPSIRVASSDAELITITNQISGNSYATINDCFDYFIGESDKFVLNSYINPIITDGLVLALDAGLVPSYPRSGTDWLDLSGNNRNGTLTNGVTFNSNGYMNFDGDNDYVAISTYTFGNGNWTVNALVAADTVQEHNLVSNTSGGPVTNAFGYDNSKIHYRNYDGAWQNHDGNTTLTTGQWYMLTWVNYAGASATDGTMKMYVNGIADSSVFNSYTVNGGPCNAIGRNWGSTEYDGLIANIQFYTESLTDEEISQNYYQAPIVTDGLVFAVDPGNLVSYENSSTTTYSLINSYTGTLSGVTYNGGNGGTWNFDGTNDYITLPDDIGYTTAVSTFAWYKSNGTPGNGYHIICGDSGLEISIYHSSGQLRTGIDTSVQRYVDNNGSTNLVDGEWHYIGFTFSGTTKTSYIDGVSVGTQTTSGDLISDVSPRALGKYPPNYFANGNMGLYTVYNKALTAAEVAQNYGAGVGRFSNTPIP